MRERAHGLPRGVTLRGGRYRVRRWIAGKQYTVGSFSTRALATAALEAACRYPEVEFIKAFPPGERAGRKANPLKPLKPAPPKVREPEELSSWQLLTAYWHMAVTGKSLPYFCNI